MPSIDLETLQERIRTPFVEIPQFTPNAHGKDHQDLIRVLYIWVRKTDARILRSRRTSGDIAASVQGPIVAVHEVEMGRPADFVGLDSSVVEVDLGRVADDSSDRIPGTGIA